MWVLLLGTNSWAIFFPTGLLRIYLGMREDKGFLKISGSPSSDALTTIRHLDSTKSVFLVYLYIVLKY